MNWGVKVKFFSWSSINFILNYFSIYAILSTNHHYTLALHLQKYEIFLNWQERIMQNFFYAALWFEPVIFFEIYPFVRNTNFYATFACGKQ
jgi:hypothetical protein